MTDNEFLEFDRITKIRSIIDKYGEDNFYIAYSGGKDSCVLSKLVDLALPDNDIPRVFCDTGIEYNLIRKFVNQQMESDSRIIIIRPNVSIVSMLEEDGYPFKSKDFSQKVHTYRTKGMTTTIEKYLTRQSNGFYCPNKLRYIFEQDSTPFKISDLCCKRLKIEPFKVYEKRSNRKISIKGLLKSEKGRRLKSHCTIFNQRGKLKSFNPIVEVTNEWEDWFIDEHDIELCALYYEPYCFERTGCKGCPFSLKLAEQLNVMKKYFPEEHKQCEIIWEPVYAEYRRIGYRLPTTDWIDIYNKQLEEHRRQLQERRNQWEKKH